MTTTVRSLQAKAAEEPRAIAHGLGMTQPLSGRGAEARGTLVLNILRDSGHGVGAQGPGVAVAAVAPWGEVPRETGRSNSGFLSRGEAWYAMKARLYGRPVIMGFDLAGGEA